MTFEEEFPSITNQGWKILNQVVSYSKILDKDDKIMIQKHCLDKQKVKEVITAYLCNYLCKKDEKIKNLRKGILGELGLKK